ncbi:MAG: GNAT family N-acetyltransferase [Dehalococcoidia bacterium]|nr:GNAT family N-acetyltransferase [Dehalococcoidia bacterium]
MAETQFRRARAADVPAILRMLADDPLGAARETVADPTPDAYLRAFEEIAADPKQWLVVGERDGEVISTMQVCVLPSLSYRGGRRAIIENVRVRADHRGRGVGSAMIRWAIDLARVERCVLVELASHRVRADAIRFYERLGFVASHVGLKLSLGER